MKTEIELKYRLSSKDDFELFRLFLEPYVVGIEVYLQKNVYFDTTTLNLRKHGVSLRLRKQNDTYLLCAKSSLGAKKHKENLSIRYEFESEIAHEIAKLLEEQLLSPVDVFGELHVQNVEEKKTRNLLHQFMKEKADVGLQIIGSFKNQRTHVMVNIDGNKINFEFDYSIYPNLEEIFEIEIEFASQDEARRLRPMIEDLFKKARLKTYKSCSKSTRLYRSLFKNE